MGVGMVFFVPAEQEEETMHLCKEAGFDPFVCGKIVEGSGKSIVK
jgi:phosphoribosylaminoimidazole (AIR) synthetase